MLQLDKTLLSLGIASALFITVTAGLLYLDKTGNIAASDPTATNVADIFGNLSPDGLELDRIVVSPTSEDPDPNAPTSLEEDLTNQLVNFMRQVEATSENDWSPAQLNDLALEVSQ